MQTILSGSVNFINVSATLANVIVNKMHKNDSGKCEKFAVILIENILLSHKARTFF